MSTAQTEAPVGPEIDIDFVMGVIAKYKGTRGAMIPVLQKIQGEYGFLPRAAMDMIGREMRISLAHIVGVASFYAQFRMTPRGKYMLKICCGTACHVKGAQRLVEKAVEIFDVPTGVTSADMMFTAERVACIGACSLAPVITVNDEAAGYLDVDKFVDLLGNLKVKAAAELAAETAEDAASA
jgi:NADH-quinone oxidoreductase subunit E